MYKQYLIIFTILGLSFNLIAQPKLEIKPDRVTFEDIFNRYDYTNLINDGDQILRIDSFSTVQPYYKIDFENAQQMPVYINPGDTVKLNIILTNFYYITVSDTTDTIWVYTNDSDGPGRLRIKIDFFDDDYGNCSGSITDEILAPLPNSKIYFFYYGIYLFDSSFTDVSGNYNKQLPTGNYTVAAEKEGYRVVFSGNTPDPYFAQSVILDSGQTANVDLVLPALSNAGFSVTGVVIDSVYGTPINKGVVIIRKGTHTPTLLKQNRLASDSSVYAGFIRSDGSYNIKVEDSTYYFVQGYSDYFLPTYYNSSNTASVFWQDADSIFVNQAIVNKNLYLERDSSYGGGGAFGTITLPFLDAQSLEGVTVLAKSLTNNHLYSYNFGKEDGRFYVNNLPYGSYQLVAQKVGFANALSNHFTISPQNQNQYNLNVQFTLTDIKEETITPTGIKLYPNYPNPFNPTTTISFYLPAISYVSLKVFDVLGKEVLTLVNEEKPSGNYIINFNASSLASGVYLYKLQVSDTEPSSGQGFVQTRKMILLK